MKIEKVKNGQMIQVPAPKGNGFDGWISIKAEFTGLLIKAEYGDGGGLILSNEALEDLGYYKLTPAKKKLLFAKGSKKVVKKD